MENRSQTIVNQEVSKLLNVSDIGIYDGRNTVLC